MQNSILKYAFLILVLLLLGRPGWSAPRQNPDGSVMQHSLALNERGTQAAKNNKLEEAEKFFREAIAVDRYNLSAAYNLAGVLITRKKESEAVSILESYTKSYPNDFAMLIRLGDAYFSLKRPNDAANAYEKAYKLEPQAEGLAFKLASVYSLQNNWSKSEEYFEKAAQSNTQNATIFANLAAIKLSLGKNDESVANAKRAIQISPSSQAYVTLGSAYENKSDFRNSLIAYERARDLGDKSADLTKKIDEIKKLQ